VVSSDQPFRYSAQTHPQAKIVTAIFNGLLGFVMLVTFCIGNFDDVLNSTVGVFGYPFVEVFAEGT
jgi:choline transport protein